MPGKQLGLRLMQAGRRTQAAVLGQPISHSLSPVLHLAAYAALGLNWSYTSIDCDEGALPVVLAARQGWAGFSCTMPLKRAALALASSATPLARAVGAANTLLPDGRGGWRADNTDVDGIVGAVLESGAAPRSVTVLGAGGTAQAAVAALPRLGVQACAVLVREPARSAPVVATGAAVGVAVRVARLEVDAAELAADLVVAALPPHAADCYSGHAWNQAQAVLDVVYDPWPTALAAAATSGGARVLPGRRVLLHQAARQVTLMTGRPAPLDAMAAALG